MSDDLVDGKLKRAGFHLDEKEGYEVAIHCSNCSWFTNIYVPFKITIKDYLKDKECERCFCKGVLY